MNRRLAYEVLAAVIGFGLIADNYETVAHVNSPLLTVAAVVGLITVARWLVFAVAMTLEEIVVQQARTRRRGVRRLRLNW